MKEGVIDKVMDYKEVRRLFNYNRLTGIFTNRVNRSIRALKGKVAGTLGSDGYWCICVNRKLYKTHRLAWLYVYGYFPEHQIDHINRIRTDNRIDNLREVSRSCNLRNSKIRSTNTSGIIGVIWNKHAKKWRADIHDQNHKLVYIGIFTSLLEAAKARYEAEVKYGYLTCQTESSALNYINEMKGINK